MSSAKLVAILSVGEGDGVKFRQIHAFIMAAVVVLLFSIDGGVHELIFGCTCLQVLLHLECCHIIENNDNNIISTVSRVVSNPASDTDVLGRQHI